MISSFSRLSSLMPGFFNRTTFANAQNGPIIMCRVVSETVSQIRKIYMPSSAFCQRFWILINLYVILALTRWVQGDNKTSSTIPPVTFKLMMVSSNYCLCGLMKVLIRQLQQLLTTVAQLLPGFCTTVITTCELQQ